MKKIPTLLLRDPNNRTKVTDEVTPGCEWVLEGEGTPTRKFDGTCTKLDAAGVWWARREVKEGKTPPQNFVPEEHDELTGKTVGWEPIAQSPFLKFWKEAMPSEPDAFESGTYELCGPRINGNPEGLNRHCLIKHGSTVIADGNGFRTINEIKRAVIGLAYQGVEGIVWHHPDGRMAKLKARDL